jgi:predicted DNA-binding WGR domain protein
MADRLVRNCGGVGTDGQELVEEFASEIEAGAALEALAKAKRRRKYRDLWGSNGRDVAGDMPVRATTLMWVSVHLRDGLVPKSP